MLTRRTDGEQTDPESKTDSKQNENPRDAFHEEQTTI